MTCTVICYEITLEKCICVSRHKLTISCKHEHLREVMVVIDPFFAMMHRA